MAQNDTQFPIVDALLLTPEEGKDGFVGVCTNTTAPGQVFNEIGEKNRNIVSVLGSLIVSRDGTERMILNSLSHPTIKYIVLFSEESLTFSPSTNLLLALQYGIDATSSTHEIINGKAASAHYPNLSEKIVSGFREQIIVLPLFMYKNDYTAPIIDSYLEWLKPKVSVEVHIILKEANRKGKIYYDTLNKLLSALQSTSDTKKEFIQLDPKEFQHLQPPKIELPSKNITPEVPFRVSAEGNNIRVDIQVGEETYFLKASDEFLLEYSIMKFLGERKNKFSALEQLFLGAEISRINTQIKNGIPFPSFVRENKLIGKKEAPLESNVTLVTDKKYYYKINVRGKQVGIMCLAFDVCEEVFELRGSGIGEIFEWLAEKNRFEEYEMDILHRIDVGGQIGRAVTAAHKGYSFIQDFATIFKINTEHMPLLIAEGDSFLDVHKKVLMKLYTEGLTEEHGDKQKGVARSGAVLAVYRNTKESLSHLPGIYKQGDRSTEEIREAYKAQLLRFDHDGDYSYGERTRSFFGFDQLPKTVDILKKNPGRATIIERFDPSKDMGSYVEIETGKTKYTHDPCLTHDIFFTQGKTLHSFHLARAHNAVNAYPENIFGLYDAYVTTIRERVGLKPGDMYMLSSRANILLLTEEQRAKKLLGEPSKPTADYSTKSGPFLIQKNTYKVPDGPAIAYSFIPLKKESRRPKSKIIDRLKNFEGVNILEKAIDYLKEKGVVHNNPILSEYQAGKMDPQGDYLAFLQANVFGKKLHMTAVFMNHSLKNKRKDIEVLNYIATKYSKALGFPLGDLSLFYVAYRT